MLELGDPQAILHPSGGNWKVITDRKVSKEARLPIALVRVLIDPRRRMADHLLKGYVQSTPILRILENEWKLAKKGHSCPLATAYLSYALLCKEHLKLIFHLSTNRITNGIRVKLTISFAAARFVFDFS